MRRRERKQGLTAMAVAGNHVVTLGWDMEEADIREKKVLGFAIQRRRHSDGEVIWLSGLKTFEAVEPDPAPGAQVSSRAHPFQTFQWADYSVSPGHTYTYRIVARTGTDPAELGDGPSLSLEVTTESTNLGKHAVYFNRGAVASQEYARRFHNRRPSEVGKSAYTWLSRGLVEGLERFIRQAGAGDELHGAFFEFKNRRIYDALEAAVIRGAAVHILYDGDSERQANEEALEGSALVEQNLTKARERSGGFAHNKFLVLGRAGVPVEVWTGSTNLSENGIFGHSNNAHLVRDEQIAGKYLAYWNVLDKDETRKPTAIKNETATPAPPAAPGEEIVPVFSPRLDLDALDWYAELAGGAQRALFATFAFGMNERFVKVYERPDEVLRFALMDKKGNGSTFKEQAADIDRIRRLPNTVVAVGNRVVLNEFDRWLAETDRIVDEAHVLYVHTKYMLIDPLGDSPTLIVGSANFSNASTTANDENMLVIRGNRDVADVYLGEFMRLFSHYAFRESLGLKRGTSGSPAAAMAAATATAVPRATPAATGAPSRKYLIPNTGWIEADGRSYYAPGSERALRRKYFSGQ
ncbi:MAG TPA: phospholipase D-like domain-containing protein [Kofleriaceae bacterium]|nr:phospholipase D-like domain-containing protein [Kofleriaceae bacterium]